MKRNTKQGKENWYALQEEGWGKIDSALHKLHMKRAGANLHLGTISHGCITVSEENSCKSQFNEMLQFLDSEAAAGYENILEVSK